MIKINKHYRNNILLGRSFTYKEDYYHLNFSFNNSYTLLLSHSYYKSFAKYKDFKNYIKGLNNDIY